MFSKYDLKMCFERNKDEGYSINPETDMIEYNGEAICTVDRLLQKIREKLHCDFESIYYEHATLTDIYRCRQCGTVIFGGDDEERYDPNCCCPVCSHDDSVCCNDWWSGEEIAADLEKQKEIDTLIQMQKESDEREERRQRRNGLYDWEIWKKKYYGKKHFFEVTLECDNLFRNGLKGLNLEIVHGLKDENGIGYTWNKHIRIPLSPYAVYVQWIVPIKLSRMKNSA